MRKDDSPLCSAGHGSWLARPRGPLHVHSTSTRYVHRSFREAPRAILSRPATPATRRRNAVRPPRRPARGRKTARFRPSPLALLPSDKPPGRSVRLSFLDDTACRRAARRPSPARPVSISVPVSVSVSWRPGVSSEARCWAALASLSWAMTIRPRSPEEQWGTRHVLLPPASCWGRASSSSKTARRGPEIVIPHHQASGIISGDTECHLRVASEAQ